MIDIKLNNHRTSVMLAVDIVNFIYNQTYWFIALFIIILCIPILCVRQFTNTICIQWFLM